MAKSNGAKQRRDPPPEPALSRITVAGFKSIGPERSIEIRPLTLLAGANSSGKSSMMQPLLLLKQTLEAPYDPGVLLLNGPNVKFTTADQLLFRNLKGSLSGSISIGFTANSGQQITIKFQRKHGKPLEIDSMVADDRAIRAEMYPGLTEVRPQEWEREGRRYIQGLIKSYGSSLRTHVYRRRCFLERELVHVDEMGIAEPVFVDTFLTEKDHLIFDTIHVPGNRGNPQRTYPVAAFGPRFPGTFENYAAGVLARSDTVPNGSLVGQVSMDLQALGLTWKIEATVVDDTQVELLVARLPRPTRSSTQDLVNIADVGFGVSQTMPVVVALAVARPGQLVYIEQPEIHLHPSAQIAMARLLANAANRGVRVVAETHSSLVLLGVQSLVAEGVLAPDKVKLHWFRRNPKDGATDIASADLDTSGAYGDWPVDFLDVSMDAQMRYAEAAFEQLRNGSHGQKSPAPPRH